MDHAVVNALQNNEHTHREKLLTEVENIVRGQAVILVYIGFLCEDGQRTGDKQLRCQRKLLRFRLRLFLDLSLQVGQCRCIALVTAGDIRTVNSLYAAVNDGTMLRFEIVLHDLLKQRQDELGLVRQRVFAVISIAFLHVQRVDAYRRRTGNVDHTAAERADHRRKLSLRVEHQHIIVRGQQHISNFLFNRERLACTGYTQSDTVTVEQICAVGNNEVAGNGVVSVTDATHLLDFLRRKRRKDGNIVSNKRALLLYAAQTIREYGVQTNVLLIG